MALIAAILIIGGGFGPNNRTLLNDGNALLFAHRGVSEFNVENSTEAFDKAKAFGFNAIETDVNCTKDGELIIFHDDSGNRLLEIDRAIKEMKWAQIKDLQLQYEGRATNNQIVSLEQFLEQQNDSIIVYFDMKVFSKQIADRLLSILDKYNKRKNIIIADSNILYLAYLKMKNPQITVALEGFNKGKEWLYYIIPKKFKADYYSSFLHEVDEDHMLFLHNNDLLNRKIVYGISHENISEVYRLGIYNIIYDYDSATSNLENIKSLLTKNKYH